MYIDNVINTMNIIIVMKIFIMVRLLLLLNYYILFKFIQLIEVLYDPPTALGFRLTDPHFHYFIITECRAPHTRMGIVK